MKKIYYLLSLITCIKYSEGQQLYCDFENNKYITFLYTDGNLDSLSMNPSNSSINNSSACGKYIRDTNLYDVIVAGLDYNCIDISPYLSNNFNTPKLSIKFFSTAPAGTYLLLQLGIKSNNQYPQGIHSEFFAVSNSTNTWETLIFSYLQTTPGTTINYNDIDKIVLLIAPGTNQQDTFYMDELIGPTLLNTLSSSHEPTKELNKLSLIQCSPNPAKENALLQFNVPNPGVVETELMDVLGKKIYNTQEYFSKSGSFSQLLELRNLPGGIYFVKIHTKNQSDTKKLILDR